MLQIAQTHSKKKKKKKISYIKLLVTRTLPTHLPLFSLWFSACVNAIVEPDCTMCTVGTVSVLYSKSSSEMRNAT